jgi:hypothetical protein
VIFWQSSLLEKKGRFGYTFWVVDSQIFLQIDMSTGFVSLVIALRARSEKVRALEKRTCDFIAGE